MPKELKTLKDIEKDVCPYHIPLNIKREAIKWVKALSDTNNPLWDEANEILEWTFESKDCYVAAVVLKYIFNITEEDLE